MKSAAGSETSRRTLSGELSRPATVTDRETGIAERRVKPRLSEPFPARAQGRDATGQKFDDECFLDNISSSGLYLRLPREMNSGAELNLVVKFLKSEDAGATARLLCRILRDEPQPDGSHGFAMTIKEHQFL